MCEEVVEIYEISDLLGLFAVHDSVRGCCSCTALVALRSAWLWQ